MPELNRLIKVLLVDDEDKTRELLKLLIDWEALGFVVAGEASSGQEGLQMLEEVRPDLILTDIKMPFMDGLQFAKLALRQCPGTKVIILTAYEDFGYAQQSIQIGVSDFLLKPIKREKLKSALQIIRSKIDEDLNIQQEYSHMQEQLIMYRSNMQEKFLNELLLTEKPNVEIEKKIHFFSMDRIVDYVQAAVVACREECPELSSEKKIIYDMVGADIVKHYFQNNPAVYVFTDQMENIVIANTDKTLQLQSVCEEIKNRISSKMQRNVSVGIGTVCEGLHGLTESYKEACEALKYCIIYGDKIVLSYRDVSVINSGSSRREGCLADIEFFVRAGLQEETIEAIHRNLAEQPLEDIEDINAVKVASINIITLLINIASELQIPVSSQKFATLYSDIISMNNFVRIESCLIDMAENLTAAVQTVRRKKNNRQIEKILQYMDKNLSDPALGLSSLSSQFYLNPSYLSRTFKRQVGSTIVEYLTVKRIKKAKEMLRIRDQLAYEIGCAVGIPDPNYFGKCFKKYVGCSIQEYRKQIEEGETSGTSDNAQAKKQISF